MGDISDHELRGKMEIVGVLTSAGLTAGWTTAGLTGAIFGTTRLASGCEPAPPDGPAQPAASASAASVVANTLAAGGMLLRRGCAMLLLLHIERLRQVTVISKNNAPRL